MKKPSPSPPPKQVQRSRPFGQLKPEPGGATIELCHDKTLLGRASPQDGITPDIDLSAYPGSESVSRRHAVIIRDGNTVVIEDLGSSNGTFVNGRKLSQGLQKTLEDNDEICLGNLSFRFINLLTS